MEQLNDWLCPMGCSVEKSVSKSIRNEDRTLGIRIKSVVERLPAT